MPLPSGRSVARLFRVIFPANPSYKTVIAALGMFSLLGLVMSLIFLSVSTPTYSSEMIIAPTQEQFASTPGNQLDRNAVSVLAGGALLSGPRVVTPYDTFLRTMQSREVATRLFGDRAVREGLFPGAWDNLRKDWKPQSGFRWAVTAPLYWITGRQRPAGPTADVVAQILRGRVNLGIIERGPMYTVSFSHADRAFGLAFLHRVFKATDAIVKEKTRALVLQRIRVLRERMNSLDVVEYRAQFMNLMIEQEKQLMLLQGNTNFAANIIVAPNAPDLPDTPRLFSTILIFISLFGLFGASCLVIIYREIVSARILPPRRITQE